MNGDEYAGGIVGHASGSVNKVYIISQPTLLRGTVILVATEKPNLSAYWPEGTVIYEAVVIGQYESVNTVGKEGTECHP